MRRQGETADETACVTGELRATGGLWTKSRLRATGELRAKSGWIGGSLGVGLWLLLLLPALRVPLESDMRLHMLVQLPLLALAGLWLGQAVPARVRAHLAPWNHQGISGLVLASVVMTVWMLPLALDAALDQPWVTAAKFLSLPLLLGLPCALSWPQAGFLVRGVFVVELIATLFRTGWLYLASPTRLCTSYLLDAQQATGQALLVAGGLLFVLAAGRLVWRRDSSCGVTRPAARSTRAGHLHPES